MAVLTFSHPPETRKKAKDALDQGMSLRKAAKETGLPHTTIHYWQRNGGLDNLDDIDPVGRVPDPQDAVDENGELVDDVPSTAAEPVVAGRNKAGFPEVPGQPQVNDGSIGVKTPVQQYPQYPQGGFGYIDQEGTQGWTPDSTHAINALLRYTNALISGARPDRALNAAQVIDPDFGLTSDQNTHLMQSISTLMMGEMTTEQLLWFADNPPDYVRSVYDQFAMTDAERSALSDELFSTYQDVYVQAISDQLMSIGEDPITEISDQSLLDKLQSRADAKASDIADTYNRDLATQVGSSWIDLSAKEGTQMSRWKLEDDASQWALDRADWKGEQIAISETSDAYASAQSDWQENNGTIDQCMFVGDDTDEPICADLLDEYGDWTNIEDCPDFGSYPHSGCVHTWDTQSIPDFTPSDDQPLWDGQ